ncbi:MAG: LLM class flavin-dependent oxidoreductase [Chloroflexi bacterium]|nr:LLM class flavin-dependent oxidoreductase [Chloroflexota bacterium]
MVKEVFFFTEMGYTAYPQDEAKKLGYNNLMFPNEYFSPEKAHELYSMYFDELQYCTEVGFDGVMINEHHNNPLCMMPSINVIGSALAKTTKKGKIVFLGNVLPIHENPLRVAEEIAMIDCMSGGRVICGFVRGLGQESMATNTNPVYNRERFDEAHNLIIKAWTTPGPFRWEGKHYQFRVVNPWVMPMQKPHPPIWIPGVVSPESVIWAARHRYPYVALAPPLDLISEIYDLYDKIAEEEGYTPTSENRGYAVRINVADSDEKAYEEGKNFYWQLGTSFGVAPRHWQAPPGYITRTAAQSGRQTRRDATRNITPDNVTPGGPSLDYEEAHATHQIVTGNPDTVIEKLKRIIDVVDPAYLVLWGREGPMSHQVAMRCIDLLSQEVIPAVKEYQADREKGRQSVAAN